MTMKLGKDHKIQLPSSRGYSEPPTVCEEWVGSSIRSQFALCIYPDSSANRKPAHPSPISLIQFQATGEIKIKYKELCPPNHCGPSHMSKRGSTAPKIEQKMDHSPLFLTISRYHGKTSKNAVRLIGTLLLRMLCLFVFALFMWKRRKEGNSRRVGGQ